jgi:hypothetical protein
LAGILVFFFSLPLWAQENRRNMDNHIPDFVEQRLQMYNRPVQSLAEINVQYNYFNEYFLEKTNSEKGSFSDSVESKHLIYRSNKYGNINVIMTLFSTPQGARNGLIDMTENYEKNGSRRYWMPWTYNRAIFIGDMYAVSNESASLFVRNNVVVDIIWTRSIPSRDLIEVIAVEIDWEICQGELDYIINNMALENHHRLIRSLDEINLLRKYEVMSSLWGTRLPEEFGYLLEETEFANRSRNYIYIEHKRGNKIFIEITIYSTPEEARKRVFMEVFRRYRINAEERTIGDLTVWDSQSTLFSRANLTVRMFATAINPTHEVLPVLHNIDHEIMAKIYNPAIR